MSENLTTKEMATINSKEVAEMMEMEHSKLLRKISGINKDFTEAKIGLSDYWLESSYVDASGKSNKCYEVTKMGCEFLAHKSTGKKGNIFTARYMERFNQMEEALEQISEKDRLLLKLFSNNPEEVASAHKQLVELETMPLIETIEEQKPLVDFASRVGDAGNAITIGEFAKILREEKGVKIGRNILFQKLRELKILDKKNLPYQDYLNKDWFKVIEKTIKVDDDQDSRLYIQTLITGKGQIKVYDLLKAKGII